MHNVCSRDNTKSFFALSLFLALAQLYTWTDIAFPVIPFLQKSLDLANFEGILGKSIQIFANRTVYSVKAYRKETSGNF